MNNILEDELAAQRAQKEQEEVGPALQEIKAVTADIGHLVASSIDRLVEKGISDERARGVVFQHLSDLVMAEDLGEK